MTRPTHLSRLLELLAGLAARGEPMVDNRQLAEALGCALATVGDHMTAAKRAGRIEVEFSPNGKQRRVRIQATGDVTDWQAVQSWWGHSKHRQGRPPKLKPVAAPRGKPGRLSIGRALAGGYSDGVLYGALADAVRECRRRGDVVHRDPQDRTAILINGHPACVKARAAWHRRQAEGRAA